MASAPGQKHPFLGEDQESLMQNAVGVSELPGHCAVVR